MDQKPYHPQSPSQVMQPIALIKPRNGGPLD